MQEQVIGVIIQQAEGNYKLGHVLNLLDKYRKSQLMNSEQFDLVYRQVIKEARQDGSNWALKYLRTVESCQSQIKTVRYNENIPPRENKSVHIASNAIEFEKQYKIINKSPSIKVVKQKANVRPIFGFVKRRYLDCLAQAFKAISSKGNYIQQTNEKAIKQHRRLRLLTKIFKKWRIIVQTKIRHSQLLSKFKALKNQRVLKRVYQSLQYYVSYEKFDQSSTIDFFKAYKDNKIVKRIFSTLFQNSSNQKNKERTLYNKAIIFHQDKVYSLYINKWKSFKCLKKIKYNKLNIVIEQRKRIYRNIPFMKWMEYHAQLKNTTIKVQLFLRKLYLIKPLSKWIQQHYRQKKLTLLIFSFKQQNRDKLVSGIFYTLYYYKQQVDQERNQQLKNYETNRTRFIKSTVFTLIISKISRKLKLQDHLIHSMIRMKQRIFKLIFNLSQNKKNTFKNVTLIQENSILSLKSKYFKQFRIAHTNSQYAILQKKKAKLVILDQATQFHKRSQLRLQAAIFKELSMILRKKIQKNKIALHLIKYYRQILKQKVLIELQNYSVMRQRQKIKFIKAQQFMKKLYKIKPMSRWIQLNFRSKRLKLITSRIRQNNNRNLLSQILISMRQHNYQINNERNQKLIHFEEYMKRETINIYFNKIKEYQQQRYTTRQRYLQIQYNSQCNQKQKCLTQIIRTFILNQNIAFLTAKAILTIKYQITSKFFIAFKNYVHRNRLPEQKVVILTKSQKVIQFQFEPKPLTQSIQEQKIQNFTKDNIIIEQKVEKLPQDKPLIDVIQLQEAQQSSKVNLKTKSKKKQQQQILVEDFRFNYSQAQMHKIFLFWLQKMQQKRSLAEKENQIVLMIQERSKIQVYQKLKDNIRKQQLKRDRLNKIQNHLAKRYQFKPMSKWILQFLQVKEDLLKIQQFQVQSRDTTLFNTFQQIKTYVNKQSGIRLTKLKQFQLNREKLVKSVIFQQFQQNTSEEYLQNKGIISMMENKRIIRIKQSFFNLIHNILDKRLNQFVTIQLVLKTNKLYKLFNVWSLMIQEQKEQNLKKLQQNSQFQNKHMKSRVLQALKNYTQQQERYRTIESEIILRRNQKLKQSVFSMIQRNYKRILHQKISEQSMLSGCTLLNSFYMDHNKALYVETFRLLIDIVHQQLANQMEQYERLINKQKYQELALGKLEVQLNHLLDKQVKKSFSRLINSSRISKIKFLKKQNYFRLWRNKVAKQQAVTMLASLNLNRIEHHYKQYFLQKIRFTSKLVKAIQIFESYALRQSGGILIKSLKLSNKIFIRQQIESRNSLLFSCFREWRLMTGEQVLLKKYLKECDNQS